MKKFFSLVLALVMAMSLATVAWGATPTDADELNAALAADVTVTLPAGDFTMDDCLSLKDITGTVTIEGAVESGVNKTTVNATNVPSWGNAGFTVAYADNVTLIFKNIDFAGAGMGIQVSASNANLTLKVENCNFNNTTGAGVYLAPAVASATFEGCTFDGCAAGVGTDGVGDLIVDDCVFEDTCGEAIGWTGTGALSVNNSVVESAINVYGTPNTDDVDVSNNYWGGGAPSDTQVPAEFVVDTYYTSVAADGTLGGLITAAGVPVNAPSNVNTNPVSMKDCALVDLTNGAVLKSFAATDKATVYKFNDVTTETNGVKVVEYGATVYYFDGAYGLVVAKDYANAQLQMANGSFVYLRGISAAEFVNSSGRTSVVVDKFIDEADEPACEAAFKDYAVVGKAFYEAEGDTLAYYKGEFVLIGAKLDAEPVYDHGFVTDPDDCKWSMTDNKLSSVKCTCDKSFKIVDSIAGKKAGTYVVLEDGVYVLLNATVPVFPTTTPSTDKVTSAETFDAGIAMYVGMSVMAAAGSVVVLKKRED